jgi:hypothetical protein
MLIYKSKIAQAGMEVFSASAIVVSETSVSYSQEK